MTPKCKTCVFNGGFRNPHDHRVVREALAKGTFVKCHNAKQDAPYKVCSVLDCTMSDLFSFEKREPELVQVTEVYKYADGRIITRSRTKRVNEWGLEYDE